MCSTSYCHFLTLGSQLYTSSYNDNLISFSAAKPLLQFSLPDEFMVLIKNDEFAWLTIYHGKVNILPTF